MTRHQTRVWVIGLLAGLMMSPASMAVDFSVTGNVAVTSDYVFRGISFSDEDPALQGGADLSIGPGFYTGIFLSTVDLPFGASYNKIGGDEDFEYDVYAGWARQWGDFGIDLGAINYGFENNPDQIDWSEAYVAGSWRWFSLRAHTQLGGMEMGDYYLGSFRYPFAERYALKLFAGYFKFDRVLRETDELTHYGVGVTADYWGFNFDLTYHDTDDEGSRRYLRFTDDRVVLTVTKRFDLFRN